VNPVPVTVTAVPTVPLCGVNDVTEGTAACADRMGKSQSATRPTTTAVRTVVLRWVPFLSNIRTGYTDGPLIHRSVEGRVHAGRLRRIPP
jgi:hypothetical protein